MSMKTVGIKNLKNSLSRYIALVKTGEKIFITEHDKIVAEIIPSTGENIGPDLLDEYLSGQEKRGSVERAIKKITIAKKRKKIRFNKGELEKIYTETRSDRL